MSQVNSTSSLSSIMNLIDLGPTGSVQMMFAKLQLAQSEICKSQATDYMKQIEEIQNEQKECAEMIERAFLDFRKTADASKLAQCMEVFRSSGQQLPRVALVPHIPDELVFLRVEYGKERERQFDDAERGSQMPPVGGNRADNGLAQFRRQDLLFGEGQIRHHGRVRDAGEKGRKGAIRFVHEECVPVVWAGGRGLGGVACFVVCGTPCIALPH